MARVRISTTVDEGLLAQARACCGHPKDATVVEQALTALIAERRSAEFDRRIDIAYRDLPLDAPDEWGDLASFLEATEEHRAPQSR